MGGRLSGRRIFVTGGASGIGAASARQLAEEGASVAVADLRGDVADEVVASIRSAGGHALSLQCDVGDETAVARAVTLATEDMGGIDGVVCSSGITRPSATHELSLADWDNVIRVNLTGMFLTIRDCLPQLLRSEASSIVTIGSVASLVSAGRACSYDASKGGVLQLTRSIAVEYADHGVRANCVCPGAVVTALVPNSQALYGADSSNRTTGGFTRVTPPMQRAAEPREIATVVSFLLSDDAAFMTGAAVSVDGGYTAI